MTLVYDGAAFTLSETLTDLANPLLTYSLTRSADIQDVVGPTGFVGFTSATGGAYSKQLISNFSFSAVPEPASIGLMAMGTLALVARRLRIYLHDARGCR